MESTDDSREYVQTGLFAETPAEVPAEASAAPAVRPPRWARMARRVGAARHSRISQRTVSLHEVSIVGLVLLIALTVLAGGYSWGSFNAALAPVTLSTAPVAAGSTPAENVYANVKDSVVTLVTPAGGTGSGFFYRPDRIVTNAHVVASTLTSQVALAHGEHPAIRVLLADGRERVGHVLGADVRLDVAVIAVPAGLGIRPLAFTSSDDLRPGEPAIAVGSPFGLTSSVSAGIISGIHRNSQFSSDPVQSTLIQTDAAVNPGNSGGPLLTASAAVVGIVTLRPDSADGRSTDGLAFAIPSTAIVPAIKELELTGLVSHPQMGLSIQAPTADSKDRSGALVVDVTSGSPAAKAGVAVGDVLLSVDGNPVKTAPQVIAAVLPHKAGDELRIVWKHAGVTESARIRLVERPRTS